MRVPFLVGSILVLLVTAACTPLTGEPDDPGDRAPDAVECDDSYPDSCIPPYPPDLDCEDVAGENFAVIGSDPHGFDGDEDGLGCEPYP